MLEHDRQMQEQYDDQPYFNSDTAIRSQMWRDSELQAYNYGLD
jgi:hypothetical protein